MAAISKVSIFNRALLKLGAKAIESFTENSKNARIGALLYDTTVQEVLTDTIWNFAQKRVELATVSDTLAFDDDGMSVIYQKPSDMLKVNFVNIPTAIYKLEGDKILSNQSGLKIKYTWNITDPAKFFIKFREALETKLAAHIAYPITAKTTLAAELFKLYYDEVLPAAKAQDAQQGTPQSPNQNEWLDSRIIGSSSIAGNTGDETWYPVGC